MGSLDIVAGMLSGLVSVIAGIGKAAEEASAVMACRVLAGGIASGAEAVYDFFGYIINLLLGDE